MSDIKELKKNRAELEAFFDFNKNTWKIWKENGVTPETELRVIFNFYASKKQRKELLVNELLEVNIPYKIKKVKTLFFLNGWKIEVYITKKWTLERLQSKTAYMFLLSKQTDTLYEGCGAFMPK